MIFCGVSVQSRIPFIEINVRRRLEMEGWKRKIPLYIRNSNMYGILFSFWPIFDRYVVFWPISMYFSRYLADTDITDIQSSRYQCRYRYGRYRYPDCRYRYIGIGHIYRLTDISVQPYKLAWMISIFLWIMFCLFTATKFPSIEANFQSGHFSIFCLLHI